VTLSLVPHPAISGRTIAGARHVDILKWITNDFYINNQHLIVSPHVTVDLIPEAATQSFILPRLGIMHSNAAPARTAAEKLVAYWRRADITGEAHLQISTTMSRQGMPFNRRADCNFKANAFVIEGRTYGAISFETEDNGWPTLDITPWTLSQLRDIIGILTCVNVCYPTSMWCTNPTRWNDKGIGHHCQYPEWSSYTGKTCPGAARIRQMDYVRTEVANRLAEFGRETGWQCGRGIAA